MSGGGLGGGGLKEGAGAPHPKAPLRPPPGAGSRPKILMVAGEASGDEHASRLVAAIRERQPQAEFFGVGGEQMAAQGVRILSPAAPLAVVGLAEVVGRLPAVARALRAIARAMRRQRPRLAILVDFPDFNFWVARLAKYYRVPVMYYISPQVWAWRTYRVRTIARLVDRMVVIFPFEAEFYREHGVPVAYVGHPLRETLPTVPDRRALLAGWDLDPERLTIALLPGSRAGEIERHLPPMLAAASLIQKTIPACQFLLPLASTAPAALVAGMITSPGGKPPAQAKIPAGIGAAALGEGVKGLAETLPNLRLLTGQSYAALAAAHLAVVASGTATVEAALAGTPSIIVYRVAPLTFRVGRRLVRVEHVGMANLLAGARLFPELLQEDFTPERLAREVLSLVAHPERLAALGAGLARIIGALGGPGASRRAAAVALELLAAPSS